MNIIITMAGDSARFRAAGFRSPKYMLIANERTLFYWSMCSLQNFFSEHFVFVTRKSHHSSDFIKKECADLGITDYQVIEIDEPTSGQAETALVAKPFVDPAKAIGIYNIDTYITQPLRMPNELKCHGWIPVFEAEGEHWSFVVFDQSGMVQEIAEKKRISCFATVGFYYFKSFDVFARCLERYGFDDYNEKYIAPLYSTLISNPNSNVQVEQLDPSDIIALGTPEDVLRFDNAFGA